MGIPHTVVGDSYVIFTTTPETVALFDRLLALVSPVVRAVAFAVWAWGLLMLWRLIEGVYWSTWNVWKGHE